MKSEGVGYYYTEKPQLGPLACTGVCEWLGAKEGMKPG